MAEPTPAPSWDQSLHSTNLNKAPPDVSDEPPNANPRPQWCCNSVVAAIMGLTFEEQMRIHFVTVPR